MGDLRVVLVPPARWQRWQDNFADRHGATTTREVDGALVGTAADGSQFEARRCLGRPWDAELESFALTVEQALERCGSGRIERGHLVL